MPLVNKLQVETANPGMKIRLGVVALLVLGLFITGLVGIFRFVENERERELQVWQTRLTIIADTRTQAIEEIGRASCRERV